MSSFTDGRIQRAATILVAALLLLLDPRLALPAGAHDPGLSSLDVTFDARAIVVTLALSPSDAVLAAKAEGVRGPLAPSDVDEYAAHLRAFATQAVAVSVEGQPLAATVERVGPEDESSVVVILRFESMTGTRLTLSSSVPARLARGHRQLLTVRRSDGSIVVERMLDGRDGGGVALDVPGGRIQRGAGFLALGVEHILSGFDHLLFLAGLLLGVAGVRHAVATATAFTVGHSITLAGATVGAVTLPSALVEPLIAASIAYVGVENILRPSTRTRWKTALAFGLIHGFGFAGVLRELGIGATAGDVALPLACFNLGVESGQIAVALLVWPALQFVRTRAKSHVRVLQACSASVAAAGLVWFVLRVV